VTELTAPKITDSLPLVKPVLVVIPQVHVSVVTLLRFSLACPQCPLRALVHTVAIFDIPFHEQNVESRRRSVWCSDEGVLKYCEVARISRLNHKGKVRHSTGAARARDPGLREQDRRWDVKMYGRYIWQMMGCGRGTATRVSVCESDVGPVSDLDLAGVWTQPWTHR
jgi:hypothetical protein